MKRNIDVALSFAGEDRSIVEKLAVQLINKGVKVFYDEFERAELWGKDLYQYLSETYYSRAKFCIVFISSNYIRKLWTNHELKSAQARAFSQNTEYILPLRIDDTVIPEILPTTGYVDLRTHSVDDVVDLILLKLGYTSVGYLSSIPYISKYPDTVLPVELMKSISNFIKVHIKTKNFSHIEIDRAFNQVSKLVPVELRLGFIEYEFISTEDGFLTEKGINILYRLAREVSYDEIVSLVNDDSMKDKVAERIQQANLTPKAKEDLVEALYRNDNLLIPVIIDVLYIESSINSAKRYKPGLSFEKDIRNKLMSAFDIYHLRTLKAEDMFKYINSNIHNIPVEIFNNFFIEYKLFLNNEISPSGFKSIYEAVNEMDV